MVTNFQKIFGGIMKRFQNRVILRLAVLALSLSSVMACGSNNTNTGAPGVTPPNATNSNAAETSNSNAPATTNANVTPGNAGQQPTQAGAKPDCGGCWVQIFDDKNFDATDDNHMICGPGKWPNLRNLPGAVKINWSDEIESLKIGPNATVIVWIGEQYTGMSQTFGPGTENANLKLIASLGDNISSIEIKCQ
jgi:hypothetical protein